MRQIFATAVMGTLALTGSPVLQPSELSLGGVAVGATEQNALEHLGQPVSRTDNEEGIDLRYRDLVVSIGWLDDLAPGTPRRVYEIIGTGKTACTPRGLCPGMTAEAAFNLYGATEPVRRETGPFFEYQPDAANCWLRISAPNGVIESLAVVCQP